MADFKKQVMVVTGVNVHVRKNQNESLLSLATFAQSETATLEGLRKQALKAIAPSKATLYKTSICTPAEYENKDVANLPTFAYLQTEHAVGAKIMLVITPEGGYVDFVPRGKTISELEEVAD